MDPKHTRTIVVDTARLIKQNKISKEDLDRLNPALRQEALSYVDSLPVEEEDLSEMKIVLKAGKAPRPYLTQAGMRKPNQVADKPMPVIPIPPQLNPDIKLPGYVPPSKAQATANNINITNNLQDLKVHITTDLKDEIIEAIKQRKQQEAMKEEVRLQVQSQMGMSGQQSPPAPVPTSPVSAPIQPAPQPIPVVIVPPPQAQTAELKPTPVIPEPKPVPPPVPKPIPPQPKVEVKPAVTKPIPPHAPKPITPAFVPRSAPTAEIKPTVNVEHQNLMDKDREVEKRKRMIGEEISSLIVMRNTEQHDLQTLKNKEKSMEEQEALIIAEEKQATSIAAIKDLEEKRWQLEDRRQMYEKDRWIIHKKVEDLNRQIEEKQKEVKRLEEEQREIKKEYLAAIVKKEAGHAGEAKVTEEKILADLREKKVTYEERWLKEKTEAESIQKALFEARQELADQKKMLAEAEKVENTITDEKGKHKAEEERWRIEAAYRQSEKKVWDLEAQASTLQKSKEELEKVFSQIQIDEQDSLDKIENYNFALSKVV